MTNSDKFKEREKLGELIIEKNGFFLKTKDANIIKNIFKYILNLLFYPKGRINKFEYILGILIQLTILYTFTSFGLQIIGNISYIDSVIKLIVLFMFFIVSIKRFHDMNMSGYLTLIPYINIILCLILSGDKKDNIYGKEVKTNVFIKLILLKIGNLGGKITNILANSLFIGIILVIIYFIFHNSEHVWIDNPTGKTIIVQVNSDGIKKEIPPKSNLEFSVTNGENEIFFNGKSVGKISKEFFDASFVNPTMSTYVSEYSLYINENLDKSYYEKYYDKLPKNTINILGNNIIGPFKKYDGLYIKGSWDYGFGDMNNKTVEKISVAKSQEYEVKEKLYRLDEFLDMYNKEYVKNVNENISNSNENVSNVTDIYVQVKYKNEKVNIASYEKLDTSKSSYVQGAWYNLDNEYLIVKMNSEYYEFCKFPNTSWINFKNASSFGKSFNSNIKGRYSC